MNCAQVTIKEDSSKSLNACDIMAARAITPFSSYPPIFIANVNGPSGCTIIKSQEVNFPASRTNIIDSVTRSRYTCIRSTNFLSNRSSSPSSSSSNSLSSGSTSHLNTILPTVSSAMPKAVSSISRQACPSSGIIIYSNNGTTWSIYN